MLVIIVFSFPYNVSFINRGVNIENVWEKVQQYYIRMIFLSQYKENICFFFRWKVEIYFIEWTKSVIFSRVAQPRVKILPIVFTIVFFSFQSHQLLFSHAGERRKYAGKTSRLNRGSNSQPQFHESDTLTTVTPGWGTCLQYKSFENTVGNGEIARNEQFLLFPTVFSWRTFCHFDQL